MTEQSNAELVAEELRDAIDHIEGAVKFQDVINPEAVRVLVQAVRALEAAAIDHPLSTDMRDYIRVAIARLRAYDRHLEGDKK